MSANPVDRPWQTPSHGSVEGLDRPPRGAPGDYAVPMPGTDRHLATPVPPVHVPKHGAAVWIQGADTWAAGLATHHDPAGRRTWCARTLPGQVDTALVHGWVPWDQIQPAAPPDATWRP